MDTSGQIRIIGQVASKIWLQPKVTIEEASGAVRGDIMRSLAARLEMHWDSLTEEENSEGGFKYNVLSIVKIDFCSFKLCS